MPEIMKTITLTNVSIYRSIAEEAHQKMHESLVAGRRPRPDGGWIIKYDPTRTSFKQALIAIAFTGMWLEAATHLAIVREYGLDTAKESDRKFYEDKLQLLGRSDRTLIERAKRLQLARRELMHEKACFGRGEVRAAQEEAENAHKLLIELRDLV